MGGNKVRSCEFWFGEALAANADLILVAGGLPSNQCRLVAATACKLGLECHILHNAEEPATRSGNQLLNQLMGVKQLFLGLMDEEKRGAALADYAASQRTLGRHPYIVGDPVVGALGYVNAALEIHAQSELKGYNISHIFIAGSMGPTEAGLLWGAALLGNAFTVHTPSVEYPTLKLRELISGICLGISAKLGFTPAVDPLSRLVAWDSFLGEGYDIPTPESIAAVYQLASLEGVFIETTYNAKLFAAAKDKVTGGAFSPEDGVCLVHTGGLPALFAQGDRFS